MGLRNKKPTMDPHTEFVMPSLVSSDEEDADDVDQQAGENASEDSEPQPAAEPEAEGPAGGQPAAAAADRVIEDEEGQVAVEGVVRWMATAKTSIRLRSDLASEKVGAVSKGKVITALYTKEVDGRQRIRCSRGWVSPVTTEGYSLLISENSTSKHFEALGDCVVREGFDKASEKLGKIPKGQVIEALSGRPMVYEEGEKAAPDAIRVQFAGGWTSNVGKVEVPKFPKGKKLLAEVAFADRAGRIQRVELIKELGKLRKVLTDLNGDKIPTAAGARVVAGLGEALAAVNEQIAEAEEINSRPKQVLVMKMGGDGEDKGEDKGDDTD